MTTKTKNILLALVLAGIALAIYVNVVLKVISE